MTSSAQTLLDEIDAVIVHFARATTQTDISPDHRTEAVKAVFDYLCAERRALASLLRAPDAAPHGDFHDGERE